MASRLKKCPSCRTHILEDATSCPFCSSRIPMKGIVATTAGIVTLIAGIGCAYGCPDNSCSGGAGGTSGAGGEGGKSSSSGLTSSSGSSGSGGMTGSSSGAGGAGGSMINDAGTD